MAKKTSPAGKNHSCWSLKCLGHCVLKALFIALLLGLAKVAVCLAMHIINVLLPVLHIILWVIFAYIVLIREEFKSFRETFYHKSCLVEIGKSFLSCCCGLKKKMFPCCCKFASCWWKGKACPPETKAEPAPKKVAAKKVVKKATPKKDAPSS